MCSKVGARSHGAAVSWPNLDVFPFADVNKPRDLKCNRDDGVVVKLAVHGLSSKKELNPIVLATGELKLVNGPMLITIIRGVLDSSPLNLPR